MGQARRSRISEAEEMDGEDPQDEAMNGMDDVWITGLLAMNGAISLVVLYTVAPLSHMKGTLCMIKTMLKSHDARIAACEEKV